MQFEMDVPMSVEDFWTLRLEISDKFREKVSSLSEENRAAMKREALASFREYSRGEGIRFPTEVFIVSGSKRHS